MKLGNLEEALDSLKKANVSDISNEENWFWLAKIFALKGNFIMCNQCVNQYELLLGKKCRGDQVRDILEDLKSVSSDILLEEKMRLQLVERLAPQEVS